MKISVVTIGYGEVAPIYETLQSVDSQTSVNIESIVVVSGLDEDENLILENKYSRPGRIFILNRDKSLYHAMNIGLQSSSGDAVMFLNSGDTFLTESSAESIEENFQFGKCLIFRTVQEFDGYGFVRPKLKKIMLLAEHPGHQGFIAPMPEAKKIPYDSEKILIGADTEWMRHLIAEFGFEVSATVISRFSLGGISNAPTLKLAKAKYREQGVATFSVIILKLLLRRLVGLSRYYRIIYFNKYELVKLADQCNNSEAL